MLAEISSLIMADPKPTTGLQDTQFNEEDLYDPDPSDPVPPAVAASAAVAHGAATSQPRSSGAGTAASESGASEATVKPEVSLVTCPKCGTKDTGTTIACAKCHWNPQESQKKCMSPSGRFSSICAVLLDLDQDSCLETFLFTLEELL